MLAYTRLGPLKTLDRVAIGSELNSAHIDISFVRGRHPRDRQCAPLDALVISKLVDSPARWASVWCSFVVGRRDRIAFIDRSPVRSDPLSSLVGASHVPAMEGGRSVANLRPPKGSWSPRCPACIAARAEWRYRFDFSAASSIYTKRWAKEISGLLARGGRQAGTLFALKR